MALGQFSTLQSYLVLFVVKIAIIFGPHHKNYCNHKRRHKFSDFVGIFKEFSKVLHVCLSTIQLELSSRQQRNPRMHIAMIRCNGRRMDLFTFYSLPEKISPNRSNLVLDFLISNKKISILCDIFLSKRQIISNLIALGNFGGKSFF